MVGTVFSDYIVNATDLRNNQKKWLERAYNEPITVNYGRKQLAIMNREKVGKLYASIYYSELVLKTCHEIKEKNRSDTLPWVDYLSDDDKFKFQSELLSTTLEAMITSSPRRP